MSGTTHTRVSVSVIVCGFEDYHRPLNLLLVSYGRPLAANRLMLNAYTASYAVSGCAAPGPRSRLLADPEGLVVFATTQSLPHPLGDVYVLVGRVWTRLSSRRFAWTLRARLTETSVANVCVPPTGFLHVIAVEGHAPPTTAKLPPHLGPPDLTWIDLLVNSPSALCHR